MDTLAGGGGGALFCSPLLVRGTWAIELGREGSSWEIIGDWTKPLCEAGPGRVDLMYQAPYEAPVVCCSSAKENMGKFQNPNGTQFHILDCGSSSSLKISSYLV